MPDQEPEEIMFGVRAAPRSDTLPLGVKAEALPATYLPHEREVMRLLVKRLDEDPEVKNELFLIHELKALCGATMLTDEEHDALWGVKKPEPVVEQPPLFVEQSSLPALNAARDAYERSRSRDHGLNARSTDPRESHAAGASTEAREGTTATFTPLSHKHLILRQYVSSSDPLTDTQAWQGAGIHYRSGAWHRCSDLLDAGAIEQVDTVRDVDTDQEVRRCRPTDFGRAVLRELDDGRRVKG